MPFTKKEILDYFEFLQLFKVRRWKGIIYQNYIFVGLICLLIFANFSNTIFIPSKDLVIIAVLGSVLVTGVFFNFYRRNFTIFWALFHNLSLGFIAIFFVFWTNLLLSTKDTIIEILPIENIKLKENRNRKGRGEPLTPVITITIKGQKHKIKYKYSKLKTIRKTRKVIATLKEGYWGYWVVLDVELLERKE